MNIVFRSSINNSRSAYDPFIFTYGHELPLWMSSQYLEEMQSSSVTSSGSLWQHVPVRMAYKSSHLAWQRENIKHRFHEDMARYQKNSELLDLLRSWREGDETEQRDTWEYLKQALDEDRLSERKLFP